MFQVALQDSWEDKEILMLKWLFLIILYSKPLKTKSWPIAREFSFLDCPPRFSKFRILWDAMYVVRNLSFQSCVGS